MNFDEIINFDEKMMHLTQSRQDVFAHKLDTCEMVGNTSCRYSFLGGYYPT